MINNTVMISSDRIQNMKIKICGMTANGTTIGIHVTNDQMMSMYKYVKTD